VCHHTLKFTEAKRSNPEGLERRRIQHVDLVDLTHLLRVRISPWDCERDCSALGPVQCAHKRIKLLILDLSFSEVFSSMVAALPACLQGVQSCQDNGWLPDECLEAFGMCTLVATCLQTCCIGHYAVYTSHKPQVIKASLHCCVLDLNF
jgi:hypothetical protein